MTTDSVFSRTNRPPNAEPGWFCEHHKDITTGEKAKHAEMYCRANRLCEVADDRCHFVWVETAGVARDD